MGYGINRGCFLNFVALLEIMHIYIRNIHVLYEGEERPE